MGHKRPAGSGYDDTTAIYHHHLSRLANVTAGGQTYARGSTNANINTTDSTAADRTSANQDTSTAVTIGAIGQVVL